MPITWTRTANRLDAKSPYQGGTFASVYEEGGKWFVRWWVGPVGVYEAPSEDKAIRWVEKYAESRLADLGRSAATPGTGPGGKGGYPPITAEERARYDAFSASYVPPKRPSRKRR